MTTSSFVLKRLADDWKLLLAIFAGIAIAATLLAGAPIYMATLERQGINTAIDRAAQSFLNIFTAASHITLSRAELDRTEQALGDAIADNIQAIYRGRERYLKTATFLVGTENNPLPERMRPGEEASVSRGYFQYMSNLEDHVTFTQGRMATESVTWEGDLPKLEAVVGVESISAFDVELGHTVQFTPAMSSPARVEVEIVGFVEPTDPTEEFWQQNPNLFMNPAPLEELPDLGVEIDPEEPPLAIFVTREALVEGVGKANPGTQVTSNWYVSIDKEGLKTWGKDVARTRIADLESDVSHAMSGSAVFTGITTMLNRFERRSFFTSVPLLLLLVVMIVTVLYYILMMVSYLVTSREPDVALLRSRGVSSWHLARIYSLEGLAITLIAVAIAPFLAAGIIAMAGKLTYFEQITLGEFLPVSIGWMPLAVAAGTGLLCLAIYVVPGVLGARSGLIVHRLRSSRPPSAPFFQRYYVDVGLMAIGGLVFWELFSRGQVVSGGLFDHARVNGSLVVRAGAASDGRSAAVHEVLPADSALPQRRVTHAAAPAVGGDLLGAGANNRGREPERRRRGIRMDHGRGAPGPDMGAVLRDVAGRAAVLRHRGLCDAGGADRAVHLLGRSIAGRGQVHPDHRAGYSGPGAASVRGIPQDGKGLSGVGVHDHLANGPQPFAV